jgi:hypothetical protein
MFSMVEGVEGQQDHGAAVLPQKRTRRSYLYVVVAASGEITEFDETKGGRKAAIRFVNERGHENIQKVYKVSEVIPLKVNTRVTVSF